MNRRTRMQQAENRCRPVAHIIGAAGYCHGRRKADVPGAWRSTQQGVDRIVYLHKLLEKEKEGNGCLKS